TIDAPEVHAARIERLRDMQFKLRRALAKVWAGAVQVLDENRLDKLCDQKTTWEHPLHIWRALRNEKEPAAAWEKLATEFQAEASKRHAFHAANSRSFGDFRRGDFDSWKWSGHGLHYGAAAPGDFTVSRECDSVIGSILPAGRFTNLYSEKL